MATVFEQASELGQSLWLDNISRKILLDGSLAKLIAQGLRGMTSNPAIFAQAISSTTDYDPSINALVRQAAKSPAVGGRSALDLYESLAIADVQLACDLFKPVYDKTNWQDGFVSLEVSPLLAFQTDATIAEAKRLHAAVGRENVMIKVPATPPGLPAIEELIASGISVNVTLLFSVDVYRQVWDRYLAGMKRWVESGGDPKRVSSVASFFVSRVDSAVDPELVNKGKKDLQGQAAIANAYEAYHWFLKQIGEPSWQELADKGARPQRVLWASTSTKNPEYSKTLYVDNLALPDTVNTLPSDTVSALVEKGMLTSVRSEFDQRITKARETLLAIEAVTPMKQVTDHLLADAVKKFADPFNKLITVLETKRQQIAGEPTSMQWSLGGMQAKVDAELAKWQKEDLVRRLWAKDKSVWTDADENNWLGWLDIVADQQNKLAEYRALADDVKSTGFTSAVLLGMGGSSLAPEVFANTFGTVSGFPKVHVLDSTVPAHVERIAKQVDLPKTVFIVASKSGSTIEPNSFKQYFFDRVKKEVSADAPGKNFIAITDPNTKMHKIALEDGFRRIVLGWPTIGGRFSALSPFGLVSLAVLGHDVGKFLSRAQQMVSACSAGVPADQNPGLKLGAALGVAYLEGRDKVTVIASPGVASLAGWLEQLIAESTGKKTRSGKAVGIVPIADEPMLAADQYGKDRIFCYLRLKDKPSSEQDAKVEALKAAGQPVIVIELADQWDLAQEMFRWEFATAVAAQVMSINPFDQPDVESAKIAARALMKQFVDQGGLPTESPIAADGSIKLFTDAQHPDKFLTANASQPVAKQIDAHLSRAKLPDYIALNCYIDMSDKHVSLLADLRSKILARYKVATTVGFGPRFLHSTGQLHKGGDNNIVVLQITCDDAKDIPIPGEQFSFSVLKSAQAAGDMTVLAERGRRILRVHVGSDVAADLSRLIAMV